MIEMELDSVDVERILSYLGTAHGGVFRRVWDVGERRMGVFVHEEYVFRTGSYQTLTTIVEEVGLGSCKITVVGSGGGGGMFNLSWGSQSAGERTIKEEIQRITGQMMD